MSVYCLADQTTTSAFALSSGVQNNTTLDKVAYWPFTHHFRPHRKNSVSFFESASTSEPSSCQLSCVIICIAPACVSTFRQNPKFPLNFVAAVKSVAPQRTSRASSFALRCNESLCPSPTGVAHLFYNVVYQDCRLFSRYLTVHTFLTKKGVPLRQQLFFAHTAPTFLSTHQGGSVFPFLKGATLSL